MRVRNRGTAHPPLIRPADGPAGLATDVKKGQHMPQEDDYGFWKDDRERSYVSGSLRPKGATRSARTSRSARPTVRSRSSDASAAGQPNPLIRRLGALCAVGLVALPVAFVVRGSNNDATIKTAASESAVSIDPAMVAADVVAVLPALEPEPVAADPAAVDSAAVAPAAVDPAAVDPAAVAPAAVDPAAVDARVASPADASAGIRPLAAMDPAIAGADTARTSAAVVAADVSAKTSCSNSYKVLAGDYWISMASRSNVKLTDLLTANGARVTTPVYPGRTICLPAGATIPTRTTAPPATAPKTATANIATQTRVTPTTSKVDPTTTKVTTPTPTTVKPKIKTTSIVPATTSAPATTSVPSLATTDAPPKNPYTRAQVEAIIRAVWPGDLADEAVRIATRESNLVPTVRNSCCFGLFQIYFGANRASLTAWGISSASALYDPEVNAFAAYAMYLRAGGWGPWGM